MLYLRWNWGTNSRRRAQHIPMFKNRVQTVWPDARIKNSLIFNNVPQKEPKKSFMGGEVACPWWGRNFSVLLQKAKIKIQNDLTDHQSASQSDNEDVEINFNQSDQCFDALKRQKCVIKKFGAPPPPCVREWHLLFYFILLFYSFQLVFRLVFRLNQSNQCFNALIRFFRSIVVVVVFKKSQIVAKIGVLHVCVPHQWHGLQCHASNANLAEVQRRNNDLDSAKAQMSSGA